MFWLSFVMVIRTLAWWCSDFVNLAHDMLIRQPLKRLYIEGPNMNGWGFWENRAESDICAALTGTTSAHWEVATDVCSDLLLRKFEAWYVMMVTSMYVLVVLYCCQCVFAFVQFRLTWAPLMRRYTLQSRPNCLVKSRTDHSISNGVMLPVQGAPGVT